MALTPIPCTDASFTLAPTLASPPPFISGFGYADGPTVFHECFFDFTPLRDLFHTAGIQFFTYTISSRAHDWAEAFDVQITMTRPALADITWFGSEFRHSPPPTSTGYYTGSGTPTQLFDEDVKSIFDTAASPAFSFDRYFLQSPVSPTNLPLSVQAACGVNPFRFFVQNLAPFQYWHNTRTQLAYATRATPPILTITNLIAWCDGAAWDCIDACIPPTIPSGHTGSVCVKRRWVPTASLPNAFVGPPGYGADLALGSLTGCNVDVVVGCLTSAQIAAGHFSGPWQANLITSALCTFAGVAYTSVLSGNFNISAGVVCSDTLEGSAAAIEVDGPRQWVHVGGGQQIKTYDNAFNSLFSGTFPVTTWRKLRADPRFGSLAALGWTAGVTPKYSVWLSTDGGQTANKISEVSATSSILERDSERNWLLWFTADGANLVSVQISLDGGQTYAAPVPVNLDTGGQLQAALLDSCQDCRSGGRLGLICAPGSDPKTPGTTAVMVSDDGGLTFRKVV